MDISIVGSGYVGLCTAVGFALKGHTVKCVDVDKDKVNAINEKRPIIEESGLEDGLKKSGKLISATNNLEKAVFDSKITFISVGTPSREDGSIDTTYVEGVAGDIGNLLGKKKDFHVVVVKSTVVPGYTEKLIIPALEKKSGKKSGKDFGVCVNPEFLREGSALDDFLSPDRILIGYSDKKTLEIMKNLYKDFKAPIVTADMKTAEMVKYASNSFLATKISFINEIGNICKKLGIDTYDVAKGMGFDKRIGKQFLNAGIGFGGSCFPKDVKALISKSKDEGYDPLILKGVMKTNALQRSLVLELLKKKAGKLSGKKIAILGLSFKPGTDDVRESPAIDIVGMMKKEKCTIVAYDPKAMKNFKKIQPDISYADSTQKALTGADACLILTEWEEFKNLEDRDFKKMHNKIIIEGRKTLDKSKVSGFEGICW